jgi:Sulfotransferase family
MSERSADASAGAPATPLRYQPRPRPEWVRGANAMGRAIDARGVVLLDERSLLETAMANTGLSDFGEDDWREPFRILIDDLERHAELHLVGRLMTRSDLLLHLEGRLRVIDWIKRHPEVEAQKIEAPVFVVGLPRSGTTIMEEILGADPNARSVRMWEAKFPVPPPRPGDPSPDPRIARADALVGLQDAITPEWASMHKVGGELPVECIEFTYSSFVSYAFSASFHVPNYTRWVARNDHRRAFLWHEKILKILQSGWKPRHWLLKGPTHLPVLPALFERYPDARLVLMLRDPVKATASVVDVSGTLFYMRSDNTALNKPHGQFIDGHPAVMALQRVIDWSESGTIPRERIQAVPYLEFFADPERGLEKLYAGLGLALPTTSRRAMLDYLSSKPRDKFGHHEYAVGGDDLIAAERAKWEKVQAWFGVRSEL